MGALKLCGFSHTLGILEVGCALDDACGEAVRTALGSVGSAGKR